MERWKLHGNISWNGYGNAIIGRYGSYFEEGNVVGLMHRRKLRGTREASKWWKGEGAYNPWTQR